MIHIHQVDGYLSSCQYVSWRNLGISEVTWEFVSVLGWIVFAVKRFPWFVLASLVALWGCSSSRGCPAPIGEEEAEAEAVCAAPRTSEGMIYEKWSGESGLVHIYRGGPVFDVGAPESAKYLARAAATSWLEPEWITAEQAQTDQLPWASERYVRWLASTAGTIHFPFYPEDWPGEWFVEVALRPKMNASMAVRFYKPDGNGGRVWSEPLTTDLTPGWHGYRWRVPREYLSKDGMQIMRVSFPGTFFEGENRVSAKFVHIGFGQLEGKTGRFKVESADTTLKPENHRVLAHELKAWSLKSGERLERFWSVPSNAQLKFYLAPASWLRTPGVLKIEAQTDTPKQVLAEYPVTPGDCWTPQTIDLKPFEDKAMRLSMTFVADQAVGSIFTQTESFRPDVLISEPEIHVLKQEKLDDIKNSLQKINKIVVLSLDNLRADRIWVQEKRRAVPGMARLADQGIQGVLMGSGRYPIATTASFLSILPAEDHQVRDTTTHLRTSITTLSEAFASKGWKSAFYSTTGMVDSARGFAQGFDSVHQLNKTGKFDTVSALEEVSTALKTSPDHTLFYVHLSELRLPHRASETRMETWGVPGYSGPVNATAMQNVLVLSNPSPQDAEQFEAYYDAELAGMDETIAQFAATLDRDTALVVFGTHGTSLGEAALGYEQGLTPWELLTPYFIYIPGQNFAQRNTHIVQAQALSATLLDIIGAQKPEGARTVLEAYDARPTASADGLTVTATLHDFYRIRREGVDALFTTGLDGTTAARSEADQPITKRAMREKIR